MGSVTVRVYNKSQTLGLGECLNIYSEILGDIQGKIAEFEEKKHANFKDECKKLITNIEEEKEKYKVCYTNGVLNLNLDDDEDISRFYRKCNAITNSNYIPPQDEKPIESKDGTEISHEKDQDCVKKVEAEKEGEAILQLNKKDSRTETLETQKPQDQSESIVDGKDPSRPQVLPHGEQDATSLEASGKSDLEEPEAKVIHPFRLNEPIENRNPSLHEPTIPSNKALVSLKENLFQLESLKKNFRNK
ncbi:hypothetical protein PCYB_003650 [Plasmodium cynomolgi strain B]|uniref:CYIR protein n=1 Tax=Plasmodium cynomolgi (strain B) TaxID=1120755 RepID=K6UF76_PLACD|nr:hypothetical protein PCYB_003650 [Plasmodium cynomolgi strain B]GAB69616.1 hypothetical protein PCYB_003650 [Plasmodium cynomolgi strain B]